MNVTIHPTSLSANELQTVSGGATSPAAPANLPNGAVYVPGLIIPCDFGRPIGPSK